MYMNFCAQAQKSFSLLGGSPSREAEFYVDFLVLPFEPNAQTVCSYSTNISTSLYICIRGKKNSALVFYFRRSRRKAAAASWFVCANRFLPDCSSSSSVVSLSDSGSNSCGS